MDAVSWVLLVAMALCGVAAIVSKVCYLVCGKLVAQTLAAINGSAFDFTNRAHSLSMKDYYRVRDDWKRWNKRMRFFAILTFIFLILWIGSLIW